MYGFFFGGATVGKSVDILWEKVAYAEGPHEETHMERHMKRN